MAKQCKIDDLEVVFRNYKDMVFKTAYLILDSAEEADDALQEVFVKVHKSWNTYDPERGALSTWIRRVTVNHCISERRRKRPLLVSLEGLEEQGFDPPDADVELPEELLIKQEQKEGIRRAMRSLDEKHRAVLVLRYSDDLSYDEIADALRIPLGTVKSRLNTAIKALREELVEGGAAS